MGVPSVSSATQSTKALDEVVCVCRDVSIVVSFRTVNVVTEFLEMIHRQVRRCGVGDVWKLWVS